MDLEECHQMFAQKTHILRRFDDYGAKKTDFLSKFYASSDDWLVYSRDEIVYTYM